MVSSGSETSYRPTWSGSRREKSRFRRAAGWIRGASLGLTALSTVVLGIDAIPGRAWIALSMVAVVTVLGGDMDIYLVKTPTADLDEGRLDHFYSDQQVIWADVSRRWNDFRKLDRGPRGDESLAGSA